MNQDHKVKFKKKNKKKFKLTTLLKVFRCEQKKENVLDLINLVNKSRT